MASKNQRHESSAPVLLSRAFALLLGLAACEAAVACTTTTAEIQESRIPPPLDEQVAEALGDLETPCLNRTPPTPGDEVLPIPQVFVESFLIEIPTESKWRSAADGLAALARVPGVKFHGSPHIIARLDDTATATLGTHSFPFGTVPEPVMFFKGITLHPTLGSPNVLVLELDVVMQVPAPSTAPSNSPYVDAHVHSTFAPHERQAVAVRTPVPGYSHGDLVIALVPHLVRSQVDLLDIFQCKMRRRADHLRQRR